jgi:hypothetical protein
MSKLGRINNWDSTVNYVLPDRWAKSIESRRGGSRFTVPRKDLWLYNGDELTDGIGTRELNLGIESSSQSHHQMIPVSVNDAADPAPFSGRVFYCAWSPAMSFQF